MLFIFVVKGTIVETIDRCPSPSVELKVLGAALEKAAQNTLS
jgi:hypothetical protein